MSVNVLFDKRQLERLDEIISQLTDISSKISDSYFTNNVDDQTTDGVIYVGKEDKDGNWLIVKMDFSSGISITGASIKNNSTYTAYADAWSARESLIYDFMKNVV